MPYFATAAPKEYCIHKANAADSITHLSFSPCGLLLGLLTHSSFQLWSGLQHRVCLYRNAKSKDRLEAEGANSLLVWKENSQHLAIGTNKSHLTIYATPISSSHLQAPGSNSVIKFDAAESSIYLADISKQITHVCTQNLSYGPITRMTCTSQHILVLTSSGYIMVVLWRKPTEILQAFACDSLIPHIRFANCGDGESILASHNRSITDLSYCNRLNLYGVVFADGSAAVMQNAAQEEFMNFSGYGKMGMKAKLMQFNSRHRLVAIGLHNAEVEIHRLNANEALGKPYSRLMLDTWGLSMEDLKSCCTMQWNRDEEVLCIGYQQRGLAVFHYSGVCLMSTVHRFASSLDPSREVLTKGVMSLSWDREGYSLVAASTGAETFVQFSFSKAITRKNASQNTRGQLMLQGCDRLMVYHITDSDFLSENWQVIPLPTNYIKENWPLQFVSVSEDGSHIAAAGSRGCALYNVGMKKWRVFGDQHQESAIRCCAPIQWVDNIVVALPNWDPQRNTCELLFYPRYHLDLASTIHKEPLQHPPIQMDTSYTGGNCSALLVYDAAHVLTMYNIHLYADSVLNPTSVSMDMLAMYRIACDPASPYPFNIRFLSDASSRQEQLQISRQTKSNKQPTSNGKPHTSLGRVIIHKADHTLVQFDPNANKEEILAREVDCFWVDLYSMSSNVVAIITFNHSGLHLYTFTHAPKFGSSEGNASADPALLRFSMPLQEADPETFPLGVMSGILAQGMEGVTTSFTNFPFPVFQVKVKPSLYSHGVLLSLVLQSSALHPQRPESMSPKSQSQAQGSLSIPCAPQVPGLLTTAMSPVASILSTDGSPFVGSPLRSRSPELYTHDIHTRQHMLQVLAEVANTLKEQTSFPHTMEYLLHSLVHADDMFEENPEYNMTSALELTIAFLRPYHEYYDVIVGCIRKTDLKKWPLLFSVVGSPLIIFDECVETGRIVTAAHLLRVLQLPVSLGYDLPKGPINTEREERQERAALTTAQEGARRLFPLALRSCRFQLACELLRFITLLNSEIASALPAQNRRDTRGGIQCAGIPIISDGAQAIVGADEDNDFKLTNGAGNNLLTEESFSSMAQLNGTQTPSSNTSAHSASLLRSDRLLRIQMETTACEMISRGETRQLMEMFGIFHLDIRHFLRTHRNGCAKVMDLGAIFDAIHLDYNLPRCPYKISMPAYPPFAEDPTQTHEEYIYKRNMVFKQYFLQYDNLFQQTMTDHNGNVRIDPLEKAILDVPDLLTITQVRLVIIPSTLQPLVRLQRLAEEIECIEYALLFATILVRLPSIVSLLKKDRSLFEPYLSLLKRQNNIGYARLLSYLMEQKDHIFAPDPSTHWDTDLV